MFVNVNYNKSLASIIAKVGPFLVVYSVGQIWLSSWIKYVNPFPDRDSINQFFFPFINYLQASKFISAEPSFITEVCFSGSYPTGSAIFPWLISLFGLQNTFINSPFLFYSIFLFLIAAVPYFFKISNQSRLLLGLLILALPITQISLKGFSFTHVQCFICGTCSLIISLLFDTKKVEILSYFHSLLLDLCNL